MRPHQLCPLGPTCTETIEMHATRWVVEEGHRLATSEPLEFG